MDWAAKHNDVKTNCSSSVKLSSEPFSAVIEARVASGDVKVGVDAADADVGRLWASAADPDDEPGDVDERDQDQEGDDQHDVLPLQVHSTFIRKSELGTRKPILHFWWTKQVKSPVH